VEEDQTIGLELWRKIKYQDWSMEEDQIIGLELWRKINYQDWNSGGITNNRI
jgi:hypothetical protein